MLRIIKPAYEFASINTVYGGASGQLDLHHGIVGGGGSFKAFVGTLLAHLRVSAHRLAANKRVAGITFQRGGPATEQNSHKNG